MPNPFSFERPKGALKPAVVVGLSIAVAMELVWIGTWFVVMWSVLP